MNPAGQLQIDLDPPSGTARIVCSRPLAIARSFVGRTPSEVLRTLPVVYSVCGTAQGIAFVSACERALGCGPSAERRRLRLLLQLSEIAREHLWRIVMDWPRLAGGEQDVTALRRVLALERRLREQFAALALTFAAHSDRKADPVIGSGFAVEIGRLIQQLVLGEPPEGWLAKTRAAELAAWADAGALVSQGVFRKLYLSGHMQAGAVDLDALPVIDGAVLAPYLRDEAAQDFIVRPVWEGRPRETTPLARQAKHPLVVDLAGAYGFGLGVRMAARLVELAWLAGEIGRIAASPAGADAEDLPPMLASTPLGQGAGIAVVETARGRLTHLIEITDERVARCSILAPTEWNFHPQGAAARALGQIALGAAADTGVLADMMTVAFDPCVEYSLTVH
jgi:coenzyme F420-reducing hydrogenase alpha subunit